MPRGGPRIIVKHGNITLLGTAHVSQKSVDEVNATIESERPDVVAVELDALRHKALTDKQRWQETPLVEMLKGGRAYYLLASAFLASYQRRIARESGVEPGAEMLAAVRAAEAKGLRLELADRDISITLKRAWARMGFFEKIKIGWEFMKAATGAGDEKVDVEGLMEEDALTLMMEELSRHAPSVTEVLVRERDAYLAGKIMEAAKTGSVVAVIGAGHLKGVKAHLEAPESIPKVEELTTIPKKGLPVAQYIGMGLVLLIVGLLVYALYQGIQSGNFEKLQEALVQYVLITGTFAAIGAALALAHPYSVVAAFVGAPFAVIHPLIASGWISGYVEAVVRKPTMKDYEELAEMERLRDFYKNRVTRVLLVAAFTNIGAMIASVIVVPLLLRVVVG